MSFIPPCNGIGAYGHHFILLCFILDVIMFKFISKRKVNLETLLSFRHLPTSYFWHMKNICCEELVKFVSIWNGKIIVSMPR